MRDFYVCIFNFLGVPARLIFHVIKIGRSTRAGKATVMENGLYKHGQCPLLLKLPFSLGSMPRPSQPIKIFVKTEIIFDNITIFAN
jgi:hypothetical protein